MCKINVKANIYYANIWKHEHVKNMTRLWCNKLKEIKRLTSIYTPLGTQLKEASKEGLMCASNKKTS